MQNYHALACGAMVKLWAPRDFYLHVGPSVVVEDTTKLIFVGRSQEQLEIFAGATRIDGQGNRVLPEVVRISVCDFSSPEYVSMLIVCTAVSFKDLRCNGNGDSLISPSFFKNAPF
jgi:hypothetical protein